MTMNEKMDDEKSMNHTTLSSEASEGEALSSFSYLLF